jgi:hypothetical protein
MARSTDRPRDPRTGRLMPRQPKDTNPDPSQGFMQPDDDVPGAFDDPVELTPPKAMPNPRLTRPPPPPSDPGDLREMQDRERLEPSELLMRQQRARHLQAIKDNPFIGSFDDSNFPRVPENDPDWAYLWMRHTLPPTPGERAELDTSNISNKINGGLRYEYVRMQDLPEAWRARFSMHRGKVDGIDGTGLLVFKDTVLCRTDRHLRDQKQEANDYYARLQREQVHDNLAEQAQARGYLARNQLNRREDMFLTPEDQAGVRKSFDEGNTGRDSPWE